MACTNNSPCFSGCVQIISDKCIKYTGNTISFLGIEYGDTLLAVEEAITNYLATVLTGAGINPVLPESICTLVNDYLPTEGGITLNDVLSALINAVCDLDTALAVERARIDTIEDDYDVDCIAADPSAGTHDILQLVIYDLCAAKIDIANLQLALNDYVLKSQITDYIQAYIDSQSTANKMYTRMVPYVIYPFWPTGDIIGNFDDTGKGSGDWEKIYICNGAYGTPDLRGRSLTGVISGDIAGTGCLDAEVDDAFGNPDYTLGMKEGVNRVTLQNAEMPAHIHTGKVSIIDPGHKHMFASGKLLGEPGCGGYELYSPMSDCQTMGMGTNAYHFFTKKEDGLNGDQKTHITATLKLDPRGQSQAHYNIHPVYAVYYIMYIPS